MTWTLRDGVSWTPTEYGGVLLDTRSGEYWTLNETGATVLGSALTGVDAPRIAAALVETFEGLDDGPLDDVRDILDELVAARLVVSG